MNPEYIDKLKATRQFCREQLMSKGLFVEDLSDEIGLIISLTSLGLNTVYATLPQTEIEYIVDNEVEL